ncbi:uncharacterized protein METZ01_LOCUS437968, partial [marine metagenome]
IFEKRKHFFQEKVFHLIEFFPDLVSPIRYSLLQLPSFRADRADC